MCRNRMTKKPIQNIEVYRSILKYTNKIMDECPICLEPLVGTVVHMGCCKNRVHIQCYVTTCPLCRAQLPGPPSSVSTIVHIPVEVVQPARKALASTFILGFLLTSAGYALFNRGTISVPFLSSWDYR